VAELRSLVVAVAGAELRSLAAVVEGAELRSPVDVTDVSAILLFMLLMILVRSSARLAVVVFAAVDVCVDAEHRYC
jgi:hypothetical protein